MMSVVVAWVLNMAPACQVLASEDLPASTLRLVLGSLAWEGFEPKSHGLGRNQRTLQQKPKRH